MSVENLVEVTLKKQDDFLKIRETLTRIGVASRTNDVLYQSCHILHKRGKYYILHFKELFILDGKPSSLDQTDIARRNAIVLLLEQWGLLDIVKKDSLGEPAPLSTIKIISFKDKTNWQLVAKYNIGKGGKKETVEQ